MKKYSNSRINKKSYAGIMVMAAAALIFAFSTSCKKEQDDALLILGALAAAGSGSGGSTDSSSGALYGTECNTAKVINLAVTTNEDKFYDFSTGASGGYFVFKVTAQAAGSLGWAGVIATATKVGTVNLRLYSTTANTTPPSSAVFANYQSNNKFAGTPEAAGDFGYFCVEATSCPASGCSGQFNYFDGSL